MSNPGAAADPRPELATATTSMGPLLSRDEQSPGPSPRICEEDRPEKRLRIIVISGPPCSGKTSLAKQVVKACGVQRVSMDDVRQRILPTSEHSKEDRDIAYRHMHWEAATHLRNKCSVVLDATYAPESHRRAVATLSKQVDADLFVIECRVDPDDAVTRFRKRDYTTHAGVDLTEARVRMLAATYPFTGCGLLLDTEDRQHNILQIQAYLATGSPVSVPEEWTGELAASSSWQNSASNKAGAMDQKFSPWSVRNAFAIKIYHYVAAVLVLSIAAYSFQTLLIADSEPGYVRATAWLSLGILAAGSFVIVEFLSRERLRQARDVVRSARELTYGPAEVVSRSDRDLFEAYRRRTKRSKWKRFAIDGRPLFFVMPPAPSTYFSVSVSRLGANWNDAKLNRRSHEQGFDWRMFSQWRLRTKGREYYGRTRRWEQVARLCDLSWSARIRDPSCTARLDVVIGRATYRDYLIAEQGTDIQVPGQVPYLREFLEGPGWMQDQLDLLDVPAASAVFPMMVSVCAVITTDDHRIVLQRKSRRVQSAGGGVAASATGAVRWHDVVDIRGRLRSNPFLRALLREIKEEIGLRKEDFVRATLETPFTAVCFGLRYGRDVNFYAHLATTLSSDKISERFRKRRRIGGVPTQAKRDQWEVAHLIFIPDSAILPDGRPDRDLDVMLGDSRHVRGALYSYRVAST